MGDDELRSALRSGSTLASLAKDRGLSQDDLVAAVKSGLEAAARPGAQAPQGADLTATGPTWPSACSRSPLRRYGRVVLVRRAEFGHGRARHLRDAPEWSTADRLWEVRIRMADGLAEFARGPSAGHAWRSALVYLET